MGEVIVIIVISAKRIITLIFGCLTLILNCKSLTGPLPLAPGWVYPYWTQAQDQLAADGIIGAPNVSADEFRFIGHQPDCLDSGGNLTGYQNSELGCIWGSFQTPRTINYSDVYRHVVIHEAKHAILYKLGYPCWKDIDDGEKGCSNP
jgi:hypothetical protein